MRLLIDETFATATYTVPITSGWVSPPDGITVEIANRLTTDSASEESIVLAPASEILRLQQTHQVAADIAVIADGNGAIAMRTPVRPDEVEATPVRLLETSGVAELLARATLRPFYGIEPTSWVRDGDQPEAARAEAVIVEGAEALREPEAGFSEDLSRAWFILTAQPVVSHVLLVPHTLPPADSAGRVDLPRCRENRGLGAETGVAAAARRPGRGWQRSCERLLGSAAAETGAGGSPGAARSARQRFAGNVQPAPGERNVH